MEPGPAEPFPKGSRLPAAAPDGARAALPACTSLLNHRVSQGHWQVGRPGGPADLERWFRCEGWAGGFRSPYPSALAHHHRELTCSGAWAAAQQVSLVPDPGGLPSTAPSPHFTPQGLGVEEKQPVAGRRPRAGLPRAPGWSDWSEKAPACIPAPPTPPSPTGAQQLWAPQPDAPHLLISTGPEGPPEFVKGHPFPRGQPWQWRGTGPGSPGPGVTGGRRASLPQSGAEAVEGVATPTQDEV